MYIQVDDQQVREVSSGYFRLRGAQKQVRANILMTLQMRVLRTFYSLFQKITKGINGNKRKKKTKVFKPKLTAGKQKEFSHLSLFRCSKKNRQGKMG